MKPKRGLRFRVQLAAGWSRTFEVTRVRWMSVYFRADRDKYADDRRIGFGEWCRRVRASTLERV